LIWQSFGTCRAGLAMQPALAIGRPTVRGLQTCEETGLTRLMYACINNEQQLVRRLLEDDSINILQQDSDGDTALHHAAQTYGGEDILASLIAARNRQLEKQGEHMMAWVDLTNNDGQTPLMYAVLMDNEPTVRQLLSSRADPFFANGEGESALSLAAGNPTLLKLLQAGSGIVQVKQKAEAVSTSGQCQHTPLMYAAMRGQKEKLQELLAGCSAADLQAQNVYGDTALIYTAAAGNLENLAQLIVRGQELLGNDISWINSRNKMGQTALHTAVGSSKANIVSALLAARADPTIQTSKGKTCLDLARGKSEIFDLLTSR